MALDERESQKHPPLPEVDAVKAEQDRALLTKYSSNQLSPTELTQIGAVLLAVASKKDKLGDSERQAQDTLLQRYSEGAELRDFEKRPLKFLLPTVFYKTTEERREAENQAANKLLQGMADSKTLSGHEGLAAKAALRNIREKNKKNQGLEPLEETVIKKI